MKTVFITGITGNQGGAVAKHCLKLGHKIIGLTRNTNSEKAKFWEASGVQLVAGTLNDPTSYQSVLEAIDTTFLMQSLQKKEDEIKEGKTFIKAVANCPSVHLVYSSVLGSDLNTGVPHFDSKWELEKFINNKKINATILRPASFYENHLHPQVSKSILKGKYVTPLNNDCIQQLIGVDDIGKIAAQVISHPDKYTGQVIAMATDQYNIGDIPGVFAKALNKPVKYSKLPGLLTRIFMGKDLYLMFKYMNKNNFIIVENINELREEFNIEGNFDQWVNAKFG